MLVANVYPSGYSEIYPLDSLSGHRAVSTIDFTVFDPAVMIETADAIYDFFILCSRWSAEDVLQEQYGGSADNLKSSWAFAASFDPYSTAGIRRGPTTFRRL